MTNILHTVRSRMSISGIFAMVINEMVALSLTEKNHILMHNFVLGLRKFFFQKRKKDYKIQTRKRWNRTGVLARMTVT